MHNDIDRVLAQGKYCIISTFLQVIIPLYRGRKKMM